MWVLWVLKFEKKNPAKPLMDFITINITFGIKTKIDMILREALCAAAAISATHLIHLFSIFVIHKKIPFPYALKQRRTQSIQKKEPPDHYFPKSPSIHLLLTLSSRLLNSNILAHA